MIYNWYKIFSLPDFLATGLVSKTYSVILENIGLKDILVTNGINVGIVYGDTFLVLGLANRNPYVRDSFGAYLDGDGNVWLGIEVPQL